MKALRTRSFPSSHRYGILYFEVYRYRYPNSCCALSLYVVLANIISRLLHQVPVFSVPSIREPSLTRPIPSLVHFPTPSLYSIRNMNTQDRVLTAQRTTRQLEAISRPCAARQPSIIFLRALCTARDPPPPPAPPAPSPPPGLTTKQGMALDRLINPLRTYQVFGGTFRAPSTARIIHLYSFKSVKCPQVAVERVGTIVRHCEQDPIIFGTFFTVVRG